MLCGCIKQALMLALRNYHALLLPTAILLIRWVSSLESRAFLSISLDCLSFIILSHQFLVHQLLAMQEGEANLIFGDLQNLLCNQRGEIAHFTEELRKVFTLPFMLFLSKYEAPL